MRGKKSNSGQQKVQRLVSVHRIDSSDVIVAWRNWVGPFCSTASWARTPLAPPTYLWDGCLPVRYFVGRTEYSWAPLSSSPTKLSSHLIFWNCVPCPSLKQLLLRSTDYKRQAWWNTRIQLGTNSHSFPWSAPVFSKGRGCRESQFW